ncbi:hypothetical protein TSUD_269210 [Trifolium subterraneum]|uniref:Cation/H+ exchanger domain-containing protein n=2 Tax=Trifolium TaxID=3898 RepID=A0A2Z6M9G3_TRISU|nr:hypothetical protein TSUD_269210 [Trifolium subterraneum]
MDPYVLFKRPSRDVQVAYAGIIITFILAVAITPFLHYFTNDTQSHLVEFTLALSILLSSTASPVLTRLITSLNIGKSDIGKLVIAAGMYSDFLSSLVLSVGYISMPLDTFCDNIEKKGRLKRAIVMNSAVLGQALFTATVSPLFMRWVNNENPEGKPMKGSHLVLSIAFMMGCGSNTSAGIALIIAIFFTVVHAPPVVAHIIKRAKRKVPTHRMSLQLLDPSSELRILLCLHGPDNISASINFMEITRGKSDPGILVYVTEMIELTNQIAVTVERGEGIETTNVKDKDVMEMRDTITSSFQAYIDDDGDGVTLKRTMAVSTINNMAQDICTLAEDLMIALIILPFHRRQCVDGKLDGGNQGFRYVNRKLLKSAPCSVGILVNRGLGSIEKISKTHVSLNVATVFIGGKDDREALAYTGRVAGHPGVKLTVIRFLVDTSVESSRISAYRVSLPDNGEEMGLDDECFAHFYDKYISGGRISYMEKHLANAAETFSTLRSFEGQYSLVIVGREGGLNSILTKGMNDWQQCPELGPIGDVLSGPDFSKTVSVLVIQQHKHKGEIDGLDEEFNIM